MKAFKIILSALTLVSSLLFGACSGDEPSLGQDLRNVIKKGELVQGKVDFNVLSPFAGSLESATYNRNDYAVYNKDSQSHGKWELIEETMYGWEAYSPGIIVVKEGKMWKQIDSFHSATGPTAFATALWLVNAAKGKNYTVYAARSCTLDAEELTLTLEGRKFDIVSAGKDNLILSHISSYEGGRTHEGGENLELSSYEKSAPMEFNDGKNLAFDSVAEAYDWLIDQFRNTFGDVVNRNSYLAGIAILDQPYFYLSTLEAERDRLTNK